MTWQTLEEEVKNLFQKIEYTPDIIIGIIRGGIIPARLLSNFLKVKDMYCLTVKKIGEERMVMSEISENLNGKQILLIEDILETGKSLIAAKKYLESKEAKVKTASLYVTPASVVKPDYYLREIKEIIQFPWD